jgi:uncharacterized membrane protein
MKTVRTFPIIIALLAFCVSVAAAQTEDRERILSFQSDIQVHKDASVTIAETIKVISAGENIKRGIYRDFPTRYKDRLGNNYAVDFEVLSIERDFNAEVHHIENLANGKRLYIGREDYLIPDGEHVYKITYRTNRQIGFFKDFDEFYWNVNGEWSFPMDKVSATIRLPGDALSRIISKDAYTGFAGDKGKDFATSFDYVGNLVFETTRGLEPQEQFTVAVSWPKGYVTEPTAQEKIYYFMRDNKQALIAVMGFFLVLVYYLTVWYRFGKDPRKGTIFALFEPPNRLSPQEVRYIMNMGFDNKTFTACVINMAVKGYIKIKEEKGEYTLEKTGSEDKLSKEEAEVSKRLFGSLNDITLKNIYHQRIQGAVDELKFSLKKDYEKTYFFTNFQYFIPGLALSALSIFVTVLFGEGGKLVVGLFMSLWLTGWSIGVSALMYNVFTLWKGFISSGSNRAFLLGNAVFLSLFSLPFLAGEFFGIGMLAFATTIAIIPVILGLVLVNLLFYRLLKAPTYAGRKIMDKIEGFKMFLMAAEKDRLNVMNPPDKTPELFEKYLPYALALDVEQQWSEQFSEVLKTASAETGERYHPGWYSGAGWSRLGASGFSSSFGSSFSGAIASSSTAPGSSSGSGGGGSSGGGGGGGGGGGW